MALPSGFQAKMERRFGADRLKQITNPGKSDNKTSTNPDVLEEAYLDAITDWEDAGGDSRDNFSINHRYVGSVLNRTYAYLLLMAVDTEESAQAFFNVSQKQFDQMKEFGQMASPDPSITENYTNSGDNDNLFPDTLWEDSGFVG